MTGTHDGSSFRLWRWLRRLFLLFLWTGAFALAAGIGMAWHRFPGTLLGMGWIWFAGLAWFALLLVILDATLELGTMPLPPSIPPDQEVRQWLLFLVMGPAAAAVFTILVGSPLVISHWVMKVLAAWPPWLRGLILFTLWMAWMIGTLMGLGLLQDVPAVTALRRTLRQRLLGLRVSEVHILSLLEASDLPPQTKHLYIRRIQRHDMTRAMALHLLEVLKAHPIEEKPPLHRAQLVQALYNWLEEREHETR